MMRLSRPLGLLAAASALLSPTAIGFQSGDAASLLQEAKAALDSGDTEAAARALRDVLASDPDNREAYRLWTSLEDQEWLEFLVQEGQLELAARRILERARAGRQELRNDPAAIRSSLEELWKSQDAIERRRIAADLGAKHGEFVVPSTLSALASSGERSAVTVSGLVQMGSRVVPPLIAALESPEPALRQTVAFVLGEIGDERAAGSLMAVAQHDADAGVRSAAGKALQSLFGPDSMPSGSALDMLAQEGLDFALSREKVLSPYDYSDVVWRFDANTLVPVETPRAFYALEVAKRRFLMALRVDASAREARAGLALVGAKAPLVADAIERAGGEVDDMQSRIEYGYLQALAAGDEALDRALLIALDNGDEAATIGTLRALGEVGGPVGAGVSRALGESDLRLRGEAAVTAAQLALDGAEAPLGVVVGALGQVVGQEVLRQVVVVDADGARREAIVGAVERIPGTSAIPVADGATALRVLVDVQGADAVLVASMLPDLTADAVVAQVARLAKFADTPVLLIAGAGEDTDMWGDRIDGTLTSANDVSTTLRPMLDQGPSVGEMLANELAGRSATALHHLARSGADLTPAVKGLMVAARRNVDAVAVPALQTLGRIGAADVMASAVTLAGDRTRSDEVRAAAADCLAGLFHAGVMPSPDLATEFAALEESLVDERSSAVRRAIATAFGALGTAASPGLLQGLDGLANQ